MKSKGILHFWIFHLVLAGFGQTLFGQTSFLDATFNPGSGADGGFVESMAVQPDGKILICGNFTSFAGQPYGYIARLNADGSLDPGFFADVGYWVRFMALQTDGKIVIGGFFATVAGETRERIARLNTNGSLDTTFNVGTGCEGKIVEADPTEPFLFALGIQADGKIIIGGNFTTYNGVTRAGLARLNSDGSLDTTFNVGSGFNSWVRSLLVQTNGQILVSGWFTSYNNAPCNRMVRINNDGSADTTFNPYFGDQTAVYTMAPQPDGKIVVVGHTISESFTPKIARLNPDGSYDSSFHPGAGANDKVESAVIQSDGKIIIGGYFSEYDGIPIENIARLNSDGTLDTTFSATVDNWIWTIALQQDAKILVCGAFNTWDGITRGGVTRLNRTPASRLLNPTKAGNVFNVSLLTENGKTYSLQYKNSAAETNWTSLPAVSGNGSIKTLSDSGASASKRFYRVRQN